jgi:hypothetical protein
MQSIIVKDFINEDELIICLHEFFIDRIISIGPFSLDKGVQDEDILFEYISLRGDFKLELCLYTNIKLSIEDLSYFICKRFKTKVLISDKNIDPYSWILITETGKIGRVDQVVREDDLFLIRPGSM